MDQGSSLLGSLVQGRLVGLMRKASNFNGFEAGQEQRDEPAPS